MSPSSALILDSVTELPDRAPSPVLLTGSHGASYAAHFALTRGIRAALFHDAGVGRDNAGIACLQIFESLGLPCASVDSMSACIGNVSDTLERGCVSRANSQAQALGVEAGMRVEDVLAAFEGKRDALAAGGLDGELTLQDETRASLDIEGAVRPVWLLDSASLICAQNEGAVFS